VLFDSGLDKALWAENLMAIYFLRNRFPTADGVSSPFERFYGRQPGFSNLRALGGVAYAMVPPRSSGKLDPKTLLGRVVRYGAGGHALRIQSSLTGKILTRRDVVVDETESIACVRPSALPVNIYLSDGWSSADSCPDGSDSGDGGDAAALITGSSDGVDAGVGTGGTDSAGATSDGDDTLRVGNTPTGTPRTSNGAIWGVRTRETDGAATTGDEGAHGDGGHTQATAPTRGSMPADAAVPPVPALTTVSAAIPTLVAPPGTDPPGHGYSLRSRSGPFPPGPSSQVAAAPAAPKPMSIAEAVACPEWDAAPPKTRTAALSRPDAHLWQAAMDTEMDGLHKANTWELVTLPLGAKLMGGRWVFAYKWDANGTVTRYKARFVAQGYTQRAGIDYTDVWAPCPARAPVRAVLAKIAALD